MKMLYKNTKIEKICTDEKKAKIKFGENVANKLFAALNAIESASNLNDIFALKQYNLHKLKGDLKNIHSMYLGKTTGYRLLLTPLDENEEPVICDDFSSYTMAVCVEIGEVSKHYD
ncbi:MAG: type II toxin-antitoxin system RelE/ParE family toxin [Erysipelotrichales bacterium]|nr:type II toxin-antitoxin system RelE/ParE family toxin [Erysipelotrichales bacterium]